MNYTVIKPFHDLEDYKRLYESGQYPREGFKPTDERIQFLANKGFIQANEGTQEDGDNGEGRKDGEETEFPKHTGGGYYELSNGEKVKGKEEAIEAENALKGV